MKKNNFMQLWLIISIIFGFAAIIYFVIVYLNNSILCNIDCRLKNEVNILLVLLSLFGVFIGSITYYIISEKYEKKITMIHRDANATLNFLESEERKIIRSIINKGGKSTQSEIVQNTGFTRVKVSRILIRLKEREIIKKYKTGMTNNIILEPKILQFFLDDENHRNQPKLHHSKLK
jgi:hypothetical protein